METHNDLIMEAAAIETIPSSLVNFGWDEMRFAPFLDLLTNLGGLSLVLFPELKVKCGKS